MTQVAVTATYLSPNNVSPAAGRVTFTPYVLTSALQPGGPFYMGTVVAELDAAGHITASLLASDTATLNPSGWTYNVREEIVGRGVREYSILVSVANAVGGINLASVAPVDPSGGTGPVFVAPVTSVDGLTGAVNLDQVRARVQQARPGNRVVIMGASIENLSSFVTATSTSFGKDWPSYAMLLGQGRFNLIANSAIGGETTQDFIDRFDAFVTPYAPNIVPLGSVENDIQLYLSLGWTLAQMTAAFKTNIKILTAKCRAIGAVPVWRTAMPHFATGVHTATGAYNAWLKEYCAQEGLPCVDFWSVLVDPATGVYRVGLTAEPGAAIHPNEQGSFLLAQYWLQQMDSMLPPGSYAVPTSPFDTGLLLPTVDFLTGAAGTPTTWNAINGTPAGTTRSLVADPLGYGQLSRHQHVASATATAIQNNSGTIVSPTNAVVGDVLEISGRYSSDSANCPATVVVTITTDGTSPSLSRVPVSIMNHPIVNGTYKMILPPLPLGFLRLQVLLQAGPGTGTVDFAYPVIRNMTREGTFPL